VEVPPPDYTTYAFCHDTSTNLPAEAAVRRVVRTAPSLAEGAFHQSSALAVLPKQKVDDIYEYIDDQTYLEPSPTYWHDSCGLQSGLRRVTLPRYCRRHSNDIIGRRTLPRGTLLLVDDDDDRHVTGCDVTRSVLALDRQGSAFYVPGTGLWRFGDSSGAPWYFPTPLTPHQATVFIAAQHQKGCFAVYKPAVEEGLAKVRPEYILAVGLSQGETQR